jgi:RNA polymerase sigma factor (sigma-70 family)
MSKQRSGRDLTRGLVARVAAGELGAKLRSQVADLYPDATRDQLEEAFQEACLLAERACHGEREGEVFTWLRTTTRHELGHIQRRARRELPVDVSTPGFERLAVPAGDPAAELIDRERRAELERVTAALLGRLSEHQRQVATLHSHGLRRSEIAAQLGLSQRSVKRALERIMEAGRDELVRTAGRGCDAGEALVARLAFGLAGTREMREAQGHLATCERCGALYERLDLWREKVAALLPLPAAARAHPGVGERLLHGVGERLSWLTQRGSESGGTPRAHAARASAQLKQHAASAYYRAIDPTPLAGARPGAVAATVAGCLALGGGATYCAQQSGDPLGGLAAMIAPGHHEQHPKPHRKRTHVAQAPPVVTPPPQLPTTTAPQQTTTTPAPTATQPQPAPAPQDEFAPGNASAAASTTTHVSSSAPARPAAAPTDGPGEFGGP